MKIACLAQAIPNWLTTVLLAILLTMLTWKLTSRGFLTWRKETADAQEQCDSEAAQPLLQDGHRDVSTHSHEALNEAFRSNGQYLGLAAHTRAEVSNGSELQHIVPCVGAAGRPFLTALQWLVWMSKVLLQQMS